MLLKIMFQVGGIDSVAFPGIKFALDLSRIRCWPDVFPLLDPVLHHHGDAGRSTCVFFLLDEWNVQPHAWLVRGQQYATETQCRKQLLHENCLCPDGDNDQDQRCDGHDNPDQIAVAESSCCKVGLRFGRARGKLRQIIITQRGNCSLDLLRIYFRGLQSFFSSRSGKKLLYSVQIMLTSLACADHLFLQIRRGDYVVLRQGVRRDSKQGDKQTSNQCSNRLPRTKRHIGTSDVFGQSTTEISIHEPCWMPGAAPQDVACWRIKIELSCFRTTGTIRCDCAASI